MPGFGDENIGRSTSRLAMLTQEALALTYLRIQKQPHTRRLHGCFNTYGVQHT